MRDKTGSDKQKGRFGAKEVYVISKIKVKMFEDGKGEIEKEVTRRIMGRTCEKM